MSGFINMFFPNSFMYQRIGGFISILSLFPTKHRVIKEEYDMRRERERKQMNKRNYLSPI